MGWKEQFIHKMFVEEDYVTGLAMYVNNAPDTIFRYRKGTENDINALKANQIWLSNMKCVNDKFEGQIEVIYDNLHLNFAFLEDALRKKVNDTIDAILEHFYIACFCESVIKDNMWSYYANDSKGFCIEYYRDDFESPQFVFPVIYQDKKIIDIDNFDENVMRRSIFTKYSDWSKEEEWRIALPINENTSNGIVIKAPRPKAVYMGTDIELPLKNTLESYCDNEVIELYQMVLDKEKRKLTTRQIL